MKKLKYKVLFVFLFYIIFFANLQAEMIELETQSSRINLDTEEINTQGNVTVKYKDIKIKADNIKKLPNRNIITGAGDVEFTQGSQKVKADNLIFDMDTKLAKIYNSESYDTNMKLRYGGQETLSEGNKKITVKNGWFTTSPYEKPNYKIEANELEIYPNRKAIARDIKVIAAGKTWLKLPYYVTSLKPASQRATLFPYVGQDSDRGLFGIMGFDYDLGPLAQGFVDFELSTKQKLALKFSNDYSFWGNNSGNIFINRFVVPIGNHKKEWDFRVTHRVRNTPKKAKEDRKFYDAGYGIWNINYQNITPNLMYAVDGSKLKDDYTAFVDKYKHIGFWDASVNQELGQNGELNIKYYWTQDKKALKALTDINDKIMKDDSLDPRRTDVDLYKSIRYTNGNKDVEITVDNEDFRDINPGYVGDLNSYRKKRNYGINFKGPKIKLDYLNSDNDEYGELLGMRDRGNDSTIHWVQKTAYDKREEWGLTFGRYYPFQKYEFFGYEQRTSYQNFSNNLYFGAQVKQVDVQRKEYDYDYTRDNENYNSLFLNSSTNDESRIYKVYEDNETIRRAKKIIYEKYRSQKFNVGNDRIELPLKDSFVGFNMGFENRDYNSVAVPKFKNGRKVEDLNSTTGYEVATNASGNTIRQTPSMNIFTMDTRLFTTLFDNTYKKNNKYDIKVTNDATVTVQRTDSNSAMYGDYDIIEIPTNALGFGNNFIYQIGNVTFNYNLNLRNDRHFRDHWLKNRYVRNYFKADIAGKRFVSFDLESNDEYEFKHFKSKRDFNREVQYGFLSNNGDNFLYKFSDKNKQIFPFNTSLGWNQKIYKESLKERTFGVNFNEWGFEYTNLISKANDIYGNTATFGSPALKLKTNYHRLGFVYDTKKMKDKKFESDHYFRINIGFGKKIYRDVKNTPTNALDDKYIRGNDYTTFGFLYRYENDAKPRYLADVEDEDKKIEEIDLGSLDTKELETQIQNSNTVKDSNTQNFSIENTNKDIVGKIAVNNDENRLFLSSEEEEAYKSYVEEENYRQNKFSLNDFNKKLQSLRSQKKYFQIGMDMQVDGSDAENPSGMKGFNKINDLSFKVETGYLDKFFVRYAFVMERPDRIYRRDPSRNSTFDFRRHEFESKYMFSKDPDKPWWIGGKLQYVQNGAPKASDPEIYESSWYAKKVNKITLGMATLSHSFENAEWEIGAGMKWDKPSNKKLGYYPVISLKFGITPFPEKNIQFNYSGKGVEFGAGL